MTKEVKKTDEPSDLAGIEECFSLRKLGGRERKE
jgi:hypothetical protein